MTAPILFSFPGDPRWSAARRAVELRFGWRGDWASAWIGGRALELIAGAEASPADAERAVYLNRARIEHQIEQRIRLRVDRGDYWMTEADARAAVATESTPRRI
jgi:hypothetical protein